MDFKAYASGKFTLWVKNTTREIAESMKGTGILPLHGISTGEDQWSLWIQLYLLRKWDWGIIYYRLEG